MLILLCSSSFLQAQDKKVLKVQLKQLLNDQYMNKFVVVLKDGLAVGLCSEKRADWTTPPTPILTVTIDSGKAWYREREVLMSGCITVVPEPIHKGEVLRVASWGISGKTFSLRVMNVSPHEVERGVGAFAHQSVERGEANILFKLDEKMDVGQVSSPLSEWFKVFDTQDSALTFGNTASGVYVKQIKTGMTIAEVESVFGPPQTRVDLTDKILYKYKDMTVEFHEGKVTDVR
jgi:hypothetical protein